MRRWLFLPFAVALGCRAVLGIDEDRPQLPAGDGGDVDGGGDADAVAEAGDAAPAEPYCASLSPQPAFCADFDEGAVSKGWQNEDRVPDPGEFGGGKIALDTMNSSSAPAAARFDLPALVTSKARASAFLLKKLTKIPSALRLDFDVFIATEYLPPQTGGNVVIATAHFVPTCSVDLVRDSVGTALAIYVGATGTRTSVVSLTEPIPVGTWKTLTIFVQPDADASDGTSVAKVDVDGIPAGSAPIPVSFRAGTTQLNIDLGAVFGGGPIGPFRSYVDNVRLYTLP